MEKEKNSFLFFVCQTDSVMKMVIYIYIYISVLVMFEIEIWEVGMD